MDPLLSRYSSSLSNMDHGYHHNATFNGVHTQPRHYSSQNYAEAQHLIPHDLRIRAIRAVGERPVDNLLGVFERGHRTNPPSHGPDVGYRDEYCQRRGSIGRNQMPEGLSHGTSASDWDRAREHGYHRNREGHIYFSCRESNCSSGHGDSLDPYREGYRPPPSGDTGSIGVLGKRYRGEEVRDSWMNEYDGRFRADQFDSGAQGFEPCSFSEELREVCTNGYVKPFRADQCDYRAQGLEPPRNSAEIREGWTNRLDKPFRADQFDSRVQGFETPRSSEEVRKCWANGYDKRFRADQIESRAQGPGPRNFSEDYEKRFRTEQFDSRVQDFEHRSRSRSPSNMKCVERDKNHFHSSRRRDKNNRFSDSFQSPSTSKACSSFREFAERETRGSPLRYSGQHSHSSHGFSLIDGQNGGFAKFSHRIALEKKNDNASSKEFSTFEYTDNNHALIDKHKEYDCSTRDLAISTPEQVGSGKKKEIVEDCNASSRVQRNNVREKGKRLVSHSEQKSLEVLTGKIHVERAMRRSVTPENKTLDCEELPCKRGVVIADNRVATNPFVESKCDGSNLSSKTHEEVTTNKSATPENRNLGIEESLCKSRVGMSDNGATGGLSVTSNLNALTLMSKKAHLEVLRKRSLTPENRTLDIEESFCKSKLEILTDGVGTDASLASTSICLSLTSRTDVGSVPKQTVTSGNMILEFEELPCKSGLEILDNGVATDLSVISKSDGLSLTSKTHVEVAPQRSDALEKKTLDHEASGIENLDSRMVTDLLTIPKSDALNTQGTLALVPSVVHNGKSCVKEEEKEKKKRENKKTIVSDSVLMVSEVGKTKGGKGVRDLCLVPDVTAAGLVGEGRTASATVLQNGSTDHPNPSGMRLEVPAIADGNACAKVLEMKKKKKRRKKKNIVVSGSDLSCSEGGRTEVGKQIRDLGLVPEITVGGHVGECCTIDANLKQNGNDPFDPSAMVVEDALVSQDKDGGNKFNFVILMDGGGRKEPNCDYQQSSEYGIMKTSATDKQDGFISIESNDESFLHSVKDDCLDPLKLQVMTPEPVYVSSSEIQFSGPEKHLGHEIVESDSHNVITKNCVSQSEDPIAEHFEREDFENLPETPELEFSVSPPAFSEATIIRTEEKPSSGCDDKSYFMDNPHHPQTKLKTDSGMLVTANDLVVSCHLGAQAETGGENQNHSKFVDQVRTKNVSRPVSAPARVSDLKETGVGMINKTRQTTEMPRLAGAFFASRSSSNIMRPRTWHRTENSSGSALQGQTILSIGAPSGKQASKKFERHQSTSYIRKGNSLVRKSAAMSTVSRASSIGQGVFANLTMPVGNPLDKKSLPVGRYNIKNSESCETKKGTTDPLAGSRTGNTTLESPNILPLNQGGKSSSSTGKSPKISPYLTSSATGIGIATSRISDSSGLKSDYAQQSIRDAEDSPVDLLVSKMLTGRSFSNEEFLKPSAPKQMTYIKPKLNQLVAAPKTNILSSSVNNNQKTQTLSQFPLPNSYVKRKKNQLVRSVDASVNKNAHASDASDDGCFSGAEEKSLPKLLTENPRNSIHIKPNKGNKMSTRSKSSWVWTLNGARSWQEDTPSLHLSKVLPSLFPWKRMISRRFARNGRLATVANKSSWSFISKKLQLLRKRDTVYTRSRSGFSLYKSGVLSIGGSNLKWSKSIERRSKRANEQATLAVAASDRKKREKRSLRNVTSAKDKKHNSCEAISDIELCPGERIFRIGSVHYKMDSSRQTLLRISDTDKEPSRQAECSTGAVSGTSFIPRRLLIGNDEYIRVGNGNKLVRNPKKMSRVLANEKVRWSLHTVRTRLARKKQYCQFFTRFGKCNKEGGKCPYIHDPEKVAVCTKFLKGCCSRTNCMLTHKVIPERMPDCLYFFESMCTNEKCPYRHVNVNPKASVCDGFLKGYCADGDEVCHILHDNY
ncbi:uncharacterized protein LOC18424673 isoform X1 [Amborella trichopoda]|uniref:uncharacterized protein LOC18424673 isoform X1 n=1 Tax=Amborella trichopoda TaxID=13333 RepID=UPI0005D3AF4F|nr:uncharacterized protein LOC18424673 isoform X1 [Amborella trichopoda]|eukprot:XP_011629129.1 uncharacterized protein LOC18424673 isoform X1 [Amborella trichopoda]